MPNANRPSGPGKPEKEQRAAADTREQFDEVELGGAAEADGEAARDPTRSARTAERDAHVGSKGRPGGRVPKR